MKLIRSDEGQWVEMPGYTKKRLLNSSDLNVEGTLVQLVTIPSGGSMQVHDHLKATEVFHVLSGSASMRAGDDVVILHAGDTITCGPGDAHGFTNHTESPLECVVFKTNWDPMDNFHGPDHV